MEQNEKKKKQENDVNDTVSKPRKLGKGLDALIPEIMFDENNAPTPDLYVKISRIEPRKDQPRRDFDEDKLQDLADSISKYGVIEPIIAQNRGTYYEIVAGERRWRAAMKAGLKEIPVIVKNFTEQEIAEISLIENVQREDLNPIEEAMAYSQLIEKYNLTQDKVASIVCKTRTTVTNTMRLLNLCEKVQEMLKDEMITPGHARALLAIKDEEQQYMIAQRAFNDDLSVRDIEKIVRELTKEKKSDTKKGLENDFIYRDFETKLGNVLGTKVNIKRRDNKKGRIEIEYYTDKEFERLSELILSIGNMS